MRWFVDINRSHGLANTIIQGAVDEERRRGRQKTLWLGNIVKWTGKTAREIHTASHNRKKWRDHILKFSGGAPTFDSDNGSVIGNKSLT